MFGNVLELASSHATGCFQSYVCLTSLAEFYEAYLFRQENYENCFRDAGWIHVLYVNTPGETLPKLTEPLALNTSD